MKTKHSKRKIAVIAILTVAALAVFCWAGLHAPRRLNAASRAAKDDNRDELSRNERAILMSWGGSGW